MESVPGYANGEIWKAVSFCDSDLGTIYECTVYYYYDSLIPPNCVVSCQRELP